MGPWQQSGRGTRGTEPHAHLLEDIGLVLKYMEGEPVELNPVSLVLNASGSLSGELNTGLTFLKALSLTLNASRYLAAVWEGNQGN